MYESVLVLSAQASHTTSKLSDRFLLHPSRHAIEGVKEARAAPSYFYTEKRGLTSRSTRTHAICCRSSLKAGETGCGPFCWGIRGETSAT
jgi:hypothetical protein